MDEIILLKGKFEVINLPDFAPKAMKLYNFLYNFFKDKGYSCKFIETNSDKLVNSHLSGNTKYLIGHSKGATKILKEFVSENFPEIKGVVLFDPKGDYAKAWNGLKIKKLLFLSKVGQTQDYSKFKNVIWLDDDHYFNNSFEKIEKILNDFISN